MRSPLLLLERRSFRCLVAIALGLAATLAFPPHGYVVLLPVSMAGLLLLWSKSDARQAFWVGACFGVGHFGLGLYWVVISTYVYGGAPIWVSGILVTLLVSYTALYPALVGYVSRRWPMTPLLWAIFQLPLLWLLFELLRGWMFTGLPWLSLGYPLVDTMALRMAPILGVHGLGALVMLVAGTLWLLVGGQRRVKLVAALVLAISTFGLVALPDVDDWTHPVGEPLTVALVQGNIAQENKWLPSMLRPTMERYLQLTHALPEDTRLIIWPEAAIPSLYHHIEDSFYKDLHAWAMERETTILTGSLRERNDRIVNTQFPVGLDSGSEYVKRHLVPFGEYFPVPDFLRLFMQGIHLDYEDIQPGPEMQSLIEIAGIKFGVSICFEDVFGRDIRRDLPEAQILVNVTNDGWFADASAPHQHLQIARMRAAEAGRPLLRVSNRGVSAHIRADGQLQATTGFLATDWLFTTVSAYEGVTPYVRWGDAPLWVAGWLALFVTLLLARRKQ